MSYSNSGNLLQYFLPSIPVAGTLTKALTAVNTAAANGTLGEFICVVPCVVKALQATVITAVVNTSASAQIVFKKCTLPNAGGTVTSIGTLKIPDASTVGQTIYKDPVNITMSVGQVVEISWVIGTGGSVAGAAVPMMFCEYDPETEANNSLQIATL